MVSAINHFDRPRTKASLKTSHNMSCLVRPDSCDDFWKITRLNTPSDLARHTKMRSSSDPGFGHKRLGDPQKQVTDTICTFFLTSSSESTEKTKAQTLLSECPVVGCVESLNFPRNGTPQWKTTKTHLILTKGFIHRHQSLL